MRTLLYAALALTTAVITLATALAAGTENGDQQP